MISPEAGADELIKAGALIRGAFGVDPWALSDADFGTLLNEALWLKHYDRELMEAAMMKVLAKAFGEG